MTEGEPRLVDRSVDVHFPGSWEIKITKTINLPAEVLGAINWIVTGIWSVAMLLVLILLGGCSTITSPTNELRLSSYTGTGGDGMIVDATGTVEGCRLVQEGDVTACVELLVGACRAWTCSIEGFAVPEQGKPINDYSQGVR